MIRTSTPNEHPWTGRGMAHPVSIFTPPPPRHSARAPSNHRGGFTLIEALCALGAVSIASLYVVRTPRVEFHSRETVTTNQLCMIAGELRAFREDNGFYPTGSNGLPALFVRAVDTTNGKGAYALQSPKDAWGRDIVYLCPGKHVASGYPYDLFSLGQPEAKTPIANWDIPCLKP